MTVFLSLCFLFFVGSCLGWCIEVVFRRFVSAKKWINPGFLTGPYLPIYGFGLVGLYAICSIPINTGNYWGDAAITIVIMGAVMTAIEYVGGLIFIKGMNIKLWDYSSQWGNVQGIICPLFFADLDGGGSRILLRHRPFRHIVGRVVRVEYSLFFRRWYIFRSVLRRPRPFGKSFRAHTRLCEAARCRRRV